MDIIRESTLIGYAPYTQEFDRIEHIEALLPPERIAEIHASLTAYRGSSRNEVIALAQAVAPMGDHISRQFEENGVNPSETTVTLLMDCSGSTRGSTAVNMTLSTIELCIALEKLGVETTVLGYTTTSWKGGASREKWVKDGKPSSPGRLCDLLHIIYKEPGATVTSCIDLLCALACDETKKENIDGEALMWASECMHTLTRPNKILLNVTDGFFPIDDSTLIANSENILFGHSMMVNNAIEEEGLIALAGVYVDLNKAHLETYQRLRDLGVTIFPRDVLTKVDGSADATFCAMVDGLSLGIKRAAELSPPEHAAAAARR